jgi:hypothetical protein
VPLTCRGRANGAGPELAGTVRHGRGHNIRGLLCVYPVSLHPIVPVCIVRIRRCATSERFRICDTYVVSDAEMTR